MNYNDLAKKYRPEEIKTLLIGEAPPPSGNRYFYEPVKMSIASIVDDTSLPATIFGHYFDRKPVTIEEYEEFLWKLKEMGVFLIDICDIPLLVGDRSQKNSRNEKNFNIVKAKIPDLRSKFEELDIDILDEDIVFLLPRGGYRRAISKVFKNSKKVQWKDFRLKRRPYN